MYKFLLFLFAPLLMAQTTGNFPPLIHDIETSISPFQSNIYYLDITAVDVDNDPLVFSCTSSSRDIDILADGSNRIRIEVNPGTTSAVITVHVADDHFGMATRTWDFLGRNQPPTIYKYFPSGFLVQNNSSGSLTAYVWDDDGDQLDYRFGTNSAPADLADLGTPQLRDTLLKTSVDYHLNHRGFVDFSLEVSDPNGGIATGTLRVQVGKLLFQDQFWSLTGNGVNPYATDLDADGNLFAVSLSPTSNFVLVDPNGNILNSGSFSEVDSVRSIVVQKHLPSQPLLLGRYETTMNLTSYTYDGSLFLGDLGFVQGITYATQHPDHSIYICYSYQSYSGIIKRDTNGNYSDVLPASSIVDARQISFDAYTGDFYLAEKGPNRISAYSADGTLIRHYPSPDIPYSQPHGVLVDPDEGVLFVADTQNNRILVLDMETGVHYQTFEGGTFFTPRFMHKLPNGKIAVGNFSKGGIEVFTYQ